MHRQTILMSQLIILTHNIQRNNPTHCSGVFHLHQTGMGQVDIIGTDRRQELFRTEIIGSLDGTHHHTGQHSRRTYFMDHDMAQFAADDLITEVYKRQS